MPIIGISPNFVLIVVQLNDRTKQPASLKGIKTTYEKIKHKFSISETHSFRYLDPPYRFCFLDILEVSPNFFISSSLPPATTPPSIDAVTTDNNKVTGKKIGFVIQNTNDNLLSDCIEELKECDIVVFSCDGISKKEISKISANPIVIYVDDANELEKAIMTSQN